jgi:DNA-binding transcriptional MerR regulator
MEDFRREYFQTKLSQLSQEEQVEVLQTLPPATRMAGLTAEQIREYLDKLNARRAPHPAKPRRRK